MLDINQYNLPVAEIVEETKTKLNDNNALIITAPPGAGKSTLLPLALLDCHCAKGKKILMLEPRRLAARQIAIRMAEMLGEPIGKTVGYRIRFETKVSAETRIEVLTEGILTRMLQSDNTLEDVGIVIFDEFHERSLFADVALAFTRECQQIVRPDLRIIIMSATIDVENLSNKLNAPIIESQGRMHKVDINYCDECDERTVADVAAHVIREAHTKDRGDILAFLPGEAEISRCEELLRGKLGDTKVMPLYGMLPQNAQRAAILPDPKGKRKIVLATPIAETSLTIEGVRIVVDSGLYRRLRFDPTSGLSHLETARISMDMATQRTGRAGRLTEGVCYRLWTKATEARMRPHREPEIIQADLSQLVLDLARWGETNAENMTWLTPPPRENILQAKELLNMLDAIDDDDRITERGLEISNLPCHPRIAQMLLAAEDDEQKSQACDIAALMEERDPLGREAGIDINIRIEALRRNRAQHLHNRKLDRIEKIAEQYRKIIGAEINNEPFDSYVTGYLIAAAYPERIASAHAGNNAQFLLSNGNLAQISHNDDLAHEPWLAISHVDAREGVGKIFLASPIDPTDLRSHIRERDVVKWDREAKRVVANHEMRIGRLLLNSKPIHNCKRELIDKAILTELKLNGKQMLNFDNVEQLQNRIASVAIWHNDEEWPHVDTDTLLASVDDWLAPYIQHVNTAADLEKIDIKSIITSTLSYEQQQALNKLAPESIKVPSGSMIRLQYFQDGRPPILAVRLQEMFGLADTPTIDNGKIPVLIHLLSPGFKAVQVTQDLRSFWNNAYFEVRKELRMRYPKHVWPEDPWNEPAIKGVKKKTQRPS